MKPSILFPFLLLQLISLPAGAQPPVQAKGDSAKIVVIKSADVWRRVKKDSLTELNMLVGHVIILQGTTIFNCDSAIQNTNLNQIEAFGNVHINDADSVHTYSQYLKYLGNTRMAYLRNKVKLTDGKGTLTTEELEYDMNSRIGTYRNKGKVVNGSSVLTSQEGYYYAETKEAYFMKDVKLVDPEYTVATDTLMYNIDSSIATFVSPTTINDGRSNIRTRSGYYDMKKGIANFGSRPVIEDSTQLIIADNIFYNKKSGQGHAEGNVFYRDSSEGVTILAGDTRFSSTTREVLATKKPVMIIQQNKDSIYVAADTLFSSVYLDSGQTRIDDSASIYMAKGVDSVNTGQGDIVPQKDSTESPPAVKRDSVSIMAPGNTLKADSSASVDRAGNDSARDQHTAQSLRADSIRFFKAYRNVRIFSDSLQGVCDSLYYSAADSIFRMFRDPVIWSAENQVFGDTIYLFTKNKKPDQLFVFENSLAISRTPQNFFNQIRGNRINGNFVNGEIDYMRAKGNAESVYYLQDNDSAYIGMNYSKADAITMYFGKDGLKRVSWVNSVEGTTYPMKQVPEEKRQLRNFKWLDNRRPKTWLELFQ